MAEEFLRCPYEPKCPLHSLLGNAMIVKDLAGKYQCIQVVDRINNCTYLHQLANEDKQTALLEKILNRLVRIDTNQL